MFNLNQFTTPCLYERIEFFPKPVFSFGFGAWLTGIDFGQSIELALE